MSTLQSRLASDLTAARKNQEKPATLLLGSTLSEIRNREIELKRDLTDDDVIEVLRRGIKKRRESMEIYEKAGRTELAATERQEVALLEKYLPAQVSPDEIRAAVRGICDSFPADYSRRKHAADDHRTVDRLHFIPTRPNASTRMPEVKRHLLRDDFVGIPRRGIGDDANRSVDLPRHDVVRADRPGDRT